MFYMLCNNGYTTHKTLCQQPSLVVQTSHEQILGIKPKILNTFITRCILIRMKYNMHLILHTKCILFSKRGNI